LGSASVDIFYPESAKLYSDLDNRAEQLTIISGLVEYPDYGRLIVEDTVNDNKETLTYTAKSEYVIGTEKITTFTLGVNNQNSYAASDSVDVYVSKPQDATPPDGWPPVGPVQSYFYGQAYGGSDLGGSTEIDVSNLGVTLLDNGDPNTEYSITGTGELGGIIYINGDLNFDNWSDIDLGGHTIYVTGKITMDTNVTLNGPGAIISGYHSDETEPEDDPAIDFQPNLGNEEYLLVLALAGSVNFHPEENTVFHGSIGGALGVNFLTNVMIDCSGMGMPLEIPGSHGIVPGDIVTWIIN
jgi:hypothetical protein